MYFLFVAISIETHRVIMMGLFLILLKEEAL